MNRISKIAVLASAAILPMTGAGTASAEQASTPEAASTASASIPDGFFKPTANTTVKRTTTATSTPATPRVDPPGSEYKVTDVDGPNDVCGTTRLERTSGAGKTTLVMTVSKSVSAQLSGEVAVAYKAVTAKLGFNVTGTVTVEDQTRYEVPKGKFGHIEAYPLFDMYTFNVSIGGGKKKAGWAMKPAGVCFNQWTE